MVIIKDVHVKKELETVRKNEDNPRGEGKEVEEKQWKWCSCKMLEIPSNTMVLKFVFSALFKIKSLIYVCKYKKVVYTAHFTLTLQIRQLSGNFCGKFTRTEKYLIHRRKGRVASSKYTGTK